ncbi:MAG: hypothetical protein NBV76_05435 [Candidatus Ochrobactrum gambitense]|nr:MAG: hypothetical protein NBV76_05435 [Candidatus Ochrobactrum gambitense]WEK17185.1 MAG: hypothetical protein P0Y54_05525 [Candidatus Ochrobactrum gambitense]
MTTVPEEAVKAETLWAVNIHGPDDLIAAPDYMSAVRMANAFNAWWLNLKTKQPHNDAIDARMWAVPTDWPGNDAHGHDGELSKPHPEYQWLREAAALPHLPQGVGVKKLDWGESRGRWFQKSMAPRYEIIGGSVGDFVLQYNCQDLSRHPTLEDAKAAAQADYKARILSALEPSAATCPCTLIQQDETCLVGYPSLLCEICDGKGVLQPFAARELVLEKDDLNARLKAKGMYSIDEMMGNLPIDKWRVHSGMTDLTFFGEWLERKSREYLTMKAAYDLGDKDESDELYEWVLAHYGAFHDVLVNFRAALPSPDHADAGKVEGNGWLPIESAPRDGSEFLAWPCITGKGNIVVKAHRYVHPSVEAWVTNEIDCGDYDFTPTHWRPLPSAPSQEVAG